MLTKIIKTNEGLPTESQWTFRRET